MIICVAVDCQKQPFADVLQNSCKACNFIKKRFQHRCCFPVNIAKFLRTAFFINTSGGCS